MDDLFDNYVLQIKGMKLSWIWCICILKFNMYIIINKQ